MDLLTVVAALSLLSVSAAKPLSCEDLIKPVVLNKTQISGKWIFIEGTADRQKYNDVLKILNSSLMDIVLSSHNGTSVIKQRTMMNVKCQYSAHELIFSNNSFQVSVENGTVTFKVLHSSPDCLILHLISVDAGEITKSLYIFGRKKTVNLSDLELYHRQTECLEFPQPSFKYDGKQDICPEEEKPADAVEGKDDHKQ